MALVDKTESNEKMNRAQSSSTILAKQGRPNRTTLPSMAPYQSRKQLSGEDVELDAIECLKSNILLLDDLQQRLAFMNKEIQFVIGCNKN